MNVQFSGSFKRLNFEETGRGSFDPYYALSDAAKLEAVKIEMAATIVQEQILTVLDDRIQLTYDPFDRRDDVRIGFRRLDGQTMRRVHKPDSSLGECVTQQKGESYESLLKRAIKYGNKLNARLTKAELKQQAKDLKEEADHQALAKVSGVILPNVEVDRSVAREHGLKAAGQYCEAIRRLAPELATLPEGIRLELDIDYGDASKLKITVDQKNKGYSSNSKVTQKARFTFPGVLFLPDFFLGAEPIEALIRRGIAYANTLLVQDEVVAQFETACQTTVEICGGNIEVSSEVVRGKGMAYGLSLLQSLKDVSARVTEMDPNMVLAYKTASDGTEYLYVNRKVPNQGYSISFLAGDKDYERTAIVRNKKESLGAFIDRTLELAKGFVAEKKSRDELRNRVSEKGQPAFVIEKAAPTPEG